MNIIIDKQDIIKIEDFIKKRNCNLTTSTKYRLDLEYFLVNNAEQGDYVCLVGCYKGSFTYIMAYLCKKLGKNLIICEEAQEFADIISKNLQELGYSDNVQVYVMPFVEFVAQQLIPSSTILTIFDIDYYYECTKKGLKTFKELRMKSYAIAFHAFEFEDTYKRNRVIKSVQEMFAEYNIFYIGENTLFSPCELHIKLAPDNTFFHASEGALIILKKQSTFLSNIDITRSLQKLTNRVIRTFRHLMKSTIPSSKKYEETSYYKNKSINEKICLINGKYGNFFIMSNDVGVGKTIKETGVWSDKHIALFKHLVKKGDTVLDIGANIGHHSVCFAKIVGDQGHVFAFEPQLPVYHILCANAMLNESSNIYPIRAAVGEQNGIVSLPSMDYNTDENFGALCLENIRRPNTQIIKKISIDEFISDPSNDISSVNFIKIDVQTFELFVLHGAIKTLTKYKPHIFVEISPYWMKKINNYDYREIYRFLKTCGYVFITPELEPTNEIPQYPLDESSAKIEWDVLAVHSGSPLIYERSLECNFI